jgi:cysteine desulfurase
MKPIYLDFNATTPIDEEVVDAMLPFLYERFGNPSSSHWLGRQAHLALEQARQQVADLIGSKPEEIIFTSGGSEANNLAILGVCRMNPKKARHLITSAVEHPAVMEVCRQLEKDDFELTVLPVDCDCRINVDDLTAALRPDTILISIMHANNEVGSIQNIKEMAVIAREKGILFHSDAAQTIGKIAVNVDDLDIDLLSIAGHKCYAPKGVGALYIRDGVGISRHTFGAGQERNIRPGTENVAGIVGLGKACEIARRDLADNFLHLREMRDLLLVELQNAFGQERIHVNGKIEKCLPNTLSVGIKGIKAHQLLDLINDDLAISAGSACHANDISISPVLKAMNVPQEWAEGTLRISTGRGTSAADVHEAVRILRQVVRTLDWTEGVR